jgi:iron complex outermembrane receptor protein
MSYVRSVLVLSTALTATFAAGGPLLAQTADGSSAALEEVIVTARRTEERLQDVPISITVFTQEQLNKNNVTNAVDLANITPSLSVNNNFGNENASFAIRGFVQDAGTAPSVGTYFADVVAPRGPTQGTQAGDSVGPGSFFDLQNVQVLKGPQGTLFGRNTTGGAVLLVPQKPTSKFEGYAEVSTGNYNMLRLQAAVNASLSDAARFRIAVDHQKRDGWLHNIGDIGPRGFNDTDYTAVRASLVLDLTANIENYTILSYSKSDTNGSFEKLIAAQQAGFNPVNPVVGIPNFVSVFSASQLASEAARGAGFWDAEAGVADPESRLEQWQAINTTTWHASDTFTVKNIASYAQFKDFQRAPLFGTNWLLSTLPAAYQFIFQAGIPRVLFETNPAPGLDSADQSTYTEEIQLQGATPDQRLTYQGGVYFEWSDPLDPVGNQSAGTIQCADVNSFNCSDTLGITFTGLTAARLAGLGVPPPYPAVNIGAVNYTVGKTSYRDKGVYAQSSYSITDQFKFTGGVRYTSDQQTNDATRITYRFPVQAPFTAGPTASCTDPLAPPGCSQFLEKKSSKPTWLIDLDYKPSDDMLLYAKYARGYRAGGVYSNAPIDHRIFNPEKVDNYEVGLKTTFRGPVPGIFNIAAFYNDFSNQQLQIGFNPYVDPLTGARAPVSPTAAIVNAGKSRIYGAEIEAAVTPVAGLKLDVNYTYLKAYIREIAPVTTSDPNYVPDVGFITSGTPLVLSPLNKAVISGNYTLPLDGNIGAISFGAAYIYTSKQQANYTYLDPAVVATMGANYGSIPSHGLVNVDLAWNNIFGSGVDLTAFGTNVTNKQYFTFIPGLAGNSGTEFAALGEPRMYGARIRYRFGGK